MPKKSCKYIQKVIQIITVNICADQNSFFSTHPWNAHQKVQKKKPIH